MTWNRGLSFSLDPRAMDKNQAQLGGRRSQGKWRWGSGKAGKAGLGLASLNNFHRLWGIDAGPGCVAPGSGVTGAGGE